MSAKSITITPVLNGFKVQVGCQEVVFNNVKQLTGEIFAYYKDPEKIEALYLKNAVNKLMNLPTFFTQVELSSNKVETGAARGGTGVQAR